MTDTLNTNENEIKQEALTIIEQAKVVKITSQETYDSATELLLVRVKPFRIRWKDYWYGTDSQPGPVKLAYRAYQSLLDKFNEADDPLEVAEKAIKKEIGIWEQEQARLLEEAQRKAQKEAEDREEEERIRAVTMAEESGATPEEVQMISESVAPVIAAPVEPTFRRATGMSKPRENWKCRVKDMKALCKAIGAGKVPITYVLPNQSALNDRAGADKNTMNIPGCEAYNDPIVAGRTK